MLSRILSKGWGSLAATLSHTTQGARAISSISEMPQLVDYRWGPQKHPVFTETEMKSRVTKLQNYIVSEGIDSVLLTSYHNINYFSGFLYLSFGRQFGMTILPDRSRTITSSIDCHWPHSMTYGDTIAYTDWHHGNFYKAIGQDLAGHSGKIGIEFDHVSLDILTQLKEKFPKTEFVDIGHATMRMRMVKSEEEMDLIRNGARIADIGGEVCKAMFKEGVAEFEVAAPAVEAMNREIMNTYPDIDIKDTWAWIMFGNNTLAGHKSLTGRRLKKGDAISINVFPMIAGYYTALERTCFLGGCTPEQLHAFEVNMEVYKRGLELIVPGAKCCDIANELNEIYLKYGVLQYRTFGYGHSFGVLCHFYGREKDLELREYVTTVLEPGHVISIEPMLAFPADHPAAGGYREHDLLAIHNDGTVENLTKFPVGPEKNIIPA